MLVKRSPLRAFLFDLKQQHTSAQKEPLNGKFHGAGMPYFPERTTWLNDRATELQQHNRQQVFVCSWCNIKHSEHTWKDHAYVCSNDEIDDGVNEHEPAEPTKWGTVTSDGRSVHVVPVNSWWWRIRVDLVKPKLGRILGYGVCLRRFTFSFNLITRDVLTSITETGRWKQTL